MTFDAARSDALHARVRAAIAAGGPVPEVFDDIARALAAYQASALQPFAKLCNTRGVDPSRASVDELPALPTDAFRYARLAAHPAAQDVRVFRTSGTTRGDTLRGAHALRTLATYEAASLAWGKRMLLVDPPPAHAIVLVPDAADVPDSSLGFMVEVFVERLGMRKTACLSLDRGVDVEAVERAAAASASDGAPAIVFATAFALAMLLDALGGRVLPLPGGSRVMVTGGFKGRTREIPTAELYAGTARAFAIEAGRVVGEYGMTELSSQLYEPGLLPGEPRREPSTYRPPPWLRVQAAHPESLAVLPAGTEGIARFVDLANVDSIAFVQTMDWIRVEPNGDVRLFGRAPGAEPRGCSLAIEDLFGDR